MNDVGGISGALLMVAGLVIYGGSLLTGLGKPDVDRQLRARIRLGSFSLVFLGAGVLIISLLVALMASAIRVR